jgi:hypothetical protein
MITKNPINEPVLFLEEWAGRPRDSALPEQLAIS